MMTRQEFYNKVIPKTQIEREKLARDILLTKKKTLDDYFRDNIDVFKRLADK